MVAKREEMEQSQANKTKALWVGGEETTRERTLPVLYILVVRWPWRGAVCKQEKVSLFLAVGSSCRQSPVL
jgi:hypothetical protein